MTLTIELTPEEEARLSAKARQAGKPVEEFLRSVIVQLTEANGSAAEARPTTGAEMVAYWERNGLFNPQFGAGEDSTELARRLREQASRRDWNSP